MATHPETDITIDAHPQQVRVSFNGETIADSAKVLELREAGYVEVLYIPRDDVCMEFLRSTDHATYCPFKGNASYWNISVGDETTENAAWSYEEPFEQVSGIKNYISFYPDRVKILVD